MVKLKLKLQPVNMATPTAAQEGTKMYREPIGPVTDVTKWRLCCEKGRQTWEYDELGNSKRDQNFIEKHALGMDIVCLLG